MKTLVFNDSARDFVLSLFDKTVDENGYVVEAESGMRVLTPSGDEVRIEDFAGFSAGAVLTRDLPSLLRYVN